MSINNVSEFFPTTNPNELVIEDRLFICRGFDIQFAGLDLIEASRIAKGLQEEHPKAEIYQYSDGDLFFVAWVDSPRQKLTREGQAV